MTKEANMENLLKIIIVILALYGLGMLSKKNEAKVEKFIDKTLSLFKKKNENS